MTAPGFADTAPINGARPPRPRLRSRRPRDRCASSSSTTPRATAGPGEASIRFSSFSILEPRTGPSSCRARARSPISSRRDGVGRRADLRAEPRREPDRAVGARHGATRLRRQRSRARPLRLAGNVVKAPRAMARLASLVRRGRFDLIYCNGTNADFAGGALARITRRAGALARALHVGPAAPSRPCTGACRRGAGVRRIVCVSRAAAALFPHCPDKVRVIHNAPRRRPTSIPARVRGTLRRRARARRATRSSSAATGASCAARATSRWCARRAWRSTR